MLQHTHTQKRDVNPERRMTNQFHMGVEIFVNLNLGRTSSEKDTSP